MPNDPLSKVGSAYALAEDIKERRDAALTPEQQKARDEAAQIRALADIARTQRFSKAQSIPESAERSAQLDAYILAAAASGSRRLVRAASALADQRSELRSELQRQYEAQERAEQKQYTR